MFNNIVEIMNKAVKAVAVIAAGVAVLHTAGDSVPNAEKKAVLLKALNELEAEFKIDLPDAAVSVAIEILLMLGKATGALKNSGTASTTPKPSK